MKLKDKVAVVTGASRGIGRQIALQLAKEGALVALHYGKNAAAAQEVLKEIEKAGGKAFTVKAELSSMAEIEQLFKQLDAELTKRTGRNTFDILVNNAGVAQQAAIEETSEDLFDYIFDVNTKALFFVTKHAIKRLNNGARIINISTAATRVMMPDFCAYTMSKCAVDGFTVLMAKHLGKQGITVNTIAPGVTDTDMAAQALTEEGKKNFIEHTALSRVGTPEDIANVTSFLASQESGWVTGQCIEASGGVMFN